MSNTNSTNEQLLAKPHHEGSWSFTGAGGFTASLEAYTLGNLVTLIWTIKRTSSTAAGSNVGTIYGGYPNGLGAVHVPAPIGGVVTGYGCTGRTPISGQLSWGYVSAHDIIEWYVNFRNASPSAVKVNPMVITMTYLADDRYLDDSF